MKVNKMYVRDENGQLVETKIIHGKNAFDEYENIGGTLPKEDFYKKLSKLADTDDISTAKEELEDKIAQQSEEIATVSNTVLTTENKFIDFDFSECEIINQYLHSGKVFATASGLTCLKIEVQENEVYKIKGGVYSAHTLYGFMDNKENIISVYPTYESGIIPSTGGTALILEETVTIPSGVKYLLVNKGGAWLVPLVQIKKQFNSYALNENLEIPRYKDTLESVKNAIDKNFGNVLWGKKLATVGTSITFGIALSLDETYGIRMTYGGITAIKNNMSFVNYGISGSTLQNVEGKNPFSVDRYKNMDKDLDYLTIEFGWNDDAYGTLGTITDTDNTTYYGARNVVLPWLIENYPNTKIGLIVPYGCTAEMREAVRIVAKKYGLGYMDMTGDSNIPFIRDREPSFNVPNVIRDLYRSRYMADNAHPNAEGYKAWATAYENFLRSL